MMDLNSLVQDSIIDFEEEELMDMDFEGEELMDLDIAEDELMNLQSNGDGCWM
jgi:hypothetical protein